MRTLILNSSNIVPNTNNSVFKYNFPAGNVSFPKGSRLALASLTMYYSTFNITAQNNNNQFAYVWVDGTENQVIFPDGFYDAASINNYLHQVMLENGHYLIQNSNGNFVWFINIGINTSAYTIEALTYPMDATTYVIGVGATEYTIPTGTAPAWVVPTNPIMNMLLILNNAFTNVIGFTPGYYPQGPTTYAQAVIAGVPPAQTQTPSYTTTQSWSSSSTPQITPLSSFILTCSLINNNYAVPNSLLYSFAPVGVFGEQFTIAPSGQLSFIDIQPGQYGSFEVSLTDQNNNPIVIQDPNMVILFAVSDVDEHPSK